MELEDFSFMGSDLTEVERDHLKILQQIITRTIFGVFNCKKHKNNSAFPAAAYSYLYLSTTIHKDDPDSPEHTDADDWLVTPNHKHIMQLVFMMRAMK
jgi:hypothetical protein